MWRWVNLERQRYYLADVVQDLFGEWTLVYAWGGIGALRGNRCNVNQIIMSPLRKPTSTVTKPNSAKSRCGTSDYRAGMTDVHKLTMENGCFRAGYGVKWKDQRGRPVFFGPSPSIKQSPRPVRSDSWQCVSC